MTDNKELAELRRLNLLNWMVKHDVSRTDLATKLGVGRAYISLLFKPERFFGEKSARSIEKKLYIPKGSLDFDQDNPGAVDEWSIPADLPEGVYAMVPRVSVKLSAGKGVVGHHEHNLPPLAFRKDWLSKKLVTGRNNLRILEVQGDSMEEYLYDKDIVLIDLGQNQIRDNEVYAIRYGDELRIKRLSKRFDGGLIIRSDNTRYPEEAIGLDDLGSIQIIGRCLWRGG